MTGAKKNGLPGGAGRAVQDSSKRAKHSTGRTPAGTVRFVHLVERGEVLLFVRQTPMNVFFVWGDTAIVQPHEVEAVQAFLAEHVGRYEHDLRAQIIFEYNDGDVLALVSDPLECAGDMQ